MLSVEQATTISPVPITRDLLTLQKSIRAEKDVIIYGRFPNKFNEINKQAENILVSLVTDTEDGKNKYKLIHELSNNLNIPKKEMETSYLDGMRFQLKAAFQLHLFESYNDNNQKITQLINAYTLGFIQTLKIFNETQTQKIPAPFILDIAKRTYLLDPDIYQKLTTEYKNNPTIKDWIIKHAISKHSKDPKGTLVLIQQEIERLTKLFENDSFVDSAMIAFAVTNNHKNPKDVIKKFKTNYDLLMIDYKHDRIIKPWMIKRIVVNNLKKDPKGTLENIKKTYKILRNKYHGDPFADKETLREFVVYHQKDTIQAFGDAKIAYKRLEKENPNIPTSYIKKAVIRYSNNPESYLDSIKQ